MLKEQSEKQKNFMEQWGIVEDDVCLYVEDDPDYDSEMIMEADYDE